MTTPLIIYKLLQDFRLLNCFYSTHIYFYCTVFLTYCIIATETMSQ